MKFRTNRQEAKRGSGTPRRNHEVTIPREVLEAFFKEIGLERAKISYATGGASTVPKLSHVQQRELDIIRAQLDYINSPKCRSEELAFSGERALAAIVNDPVIIYYLLANNGVTDSSAQELFMEKLALAVVDGGLDRYRLQFLIDGKQIHTGGATLYLDGRWPVEKLREHVAQVVEQCERIRSDSMSFWRTHLGRK